MAKTTEKSRYNNIEKILPSGGPNEAPLDMSNFIQLASESAAEERDLSDFMDMKYGEALDKFLESNPGKTEDDFIKLIRMPMEAGGKVIKFSDYKKPQVKELDLASLFTPGKTLAELTPSERDTVNNLLKMTFGKKD